MTVGSIGIPQMPPCTHDENCPRDAKDMPGHRHRAKDGTVKAKRGDTHLGTLEDKYGEISRMPDDVHLSELRKKSGRKGLNKVIPKIKEQESICKINKVV